MSPVLWAAAWALTVLTVAAARRPRRAARRSRALVPVTAEPAPVSPAGLRGRVGAVVVGAVWRPPSRPSPAWVGTAEQVGGAVIAAAPLLVVLPVAAVPAAFVAWLWPRVRLRRDDRRRLEAVEGALPDVVDLLAVAVGAGLTVPLALEVVARRAPGTLADELARARAESRRGRRLAEALDDLPTRLGEPVRPLVRALVASERDGAPLGAGLDRLAEEVRARQRRRAEETARRVPVKLLFPLVLCILPAFAVLTVAPLVLSALRSLRV